MKEYLTLGPVPAEESCEQVGMPYYDPIKARQETARYIALLHLILHREFKDLHVTVGRKSFEHDAGTYCEAVVWYDPDDEIAVKQAFWLESNTPLTWEDNNESHEKHFQDLVDNVLIRATPSQIEFVRKVFFAGAAALMAELAIVKSLPEGLDEERLQEVFNEISAFAIKVIKE